MGHKSRLQLGFLLFLFTLGFSPVNSNAEEIGDRLPGPYVVNVTSSNPDGVYGQGEVIEVLIQLNEPVQAYFPENKNCVSKRGGLNWISLNTMGGQGESKVINSITGLELRATYTVGNVDVERLNVVSPSIYSECGLKTESGNILDSIPLPDPDGPNSLAANRHIKLAGYGAKIVSVSSRQSEGLYRPNDSLDFHLEFNRPVTVHPIIQPYLRLKVSAQSHQDLFGRVSLASYVSGSGTNTLVFRYQGTREITWDKYDNRNPNQWRLRVGGTSPLMVDLGAVRDEDLASVQAWLEPRPLRSLILDDRGYKTNLDATGASYEGNIYVQTKSNQTGIGKIIGVKALVPNGSYGPGQQIPIEVEFDRPVFVTGKPALNLNQRKTRQGNYFEIASSAWYLSGSGTTKLIFLYKVSNEDPETPMLEYVFPRRGMATPSPLSDLPKGSIKWFNVPSGITAIYYLHRQFGHCATSVCSIKDARGAFMNLELPAVGQKGSLGFNSKITISRKRILETDSK